MRRNRRGKFKQGSQRMDPQRNMQLGCLAIFFPHKHQLDTTEGDGKQTTTHQKLKQDYAGDTAFTQGEWRSRRRVTA
jgi:hypothetical protein